MVGCGALGLQSCFLVTVPMKAAGEIVEKSAYATRDLGSRGIRKLREPAGTPPDQGGPASYPGYGSPEPYPDYGSDAYYGD